MAWLLDHGTDPWNILLLTFTNKAAREMTERVRSLIPLDLSRLWSGTFHSIANRILRQHAEYLGYTPTFTIMDSDDRRKTPITTFPTTWTPSWRCMTNT